jgi:hypothetical protein
MTYPQLLRCPCIKIDRFDLADMGAHSTVDTRATNTQKDATKAHMKRRKKRIWENAHVPRRPTRILWEQEQR